MRYDNQDLLDAGNEVMGNHGFTVRQYQARVLTIIREIDRICKKNHITYFIMYGSLIGAVRHKGFIPWDDDADVIMTRENFNRFKTACETELDKSYDFLHYLDACDGSAYTFSRIRERETTYIIKSEITRHGRSAGFYVDIMTLDYLSENRFYRKLQERCLLGLHRLVSPGFSQGIQHLSAAEDALIILLSSVAGRKNAIRLMERILSSVPKEKSSFVISNYLIQSRMSMHIYPKEHFETCRYVPFEGVMLPIPDKALSLLNLMYCKSNAGRHINFDSQYEDENEAIREHSLHQYNDILFIPQERGRDRHMEVVFDGSFPSSRYDTYYFKYIDRKENDRCARRERHYQEKAAGYQKKMAENSQIAENSCRELQLKDELQEFGLSLDIALGEGNLKPAVDLVNHIRQLKAWRHENLTEHEMILCVRTCLMTGYIADGYRLLKRTGYKYPQDGTGVRSALERLCGDLLNAHYGIARKDESAVRRFMDAYDFPAGGMMHELCAGVLMYWENRTEEARAVFDRCILMDPDCYWANYHMGLITGTDDSAKAAEYLKNAMNATTFMPLIERAVDEIKRIEREDGLCVISML